MKKTNIAMAGAALLMLISAPALSQQDLVGTVTKIDRTKGTNAIQPEQSGTVGSSAGGTTAEFKTQDRSWLDAVHAGDKVSYAISETGGVHMITKLQKQ